ncbi:hypothetical protein V8E55_006192 [Tylopilus felleus]
MDMPIPPVTKPVARLGVRALKLWVKRSFTGAQKRDARTHASYIELPREFWDKIVLLMFICCLFTFLHALLGFGVVDKDLHALNRTWILPHAMLCISSPWQHGSGASNGDQEMHTRGVTRVMIDWLGNHEFLPSAASALVSPGTVPQDGFPDPTAALEEGSLSVTTKTKVPVDTPFMFDETSYDPSQVQLEFEDSAHGGEIRGLYPIAGPPRTAPYGARARRFGRCLPGEACW